MKLTLDPQKRLAEINAACAAQWRYNQGKIKAEGLKPLTAEAGTIFGAGFVQGAGWAHKSFGDAIAPLSRTGESWRGLEPYPVDSAGAYLLPDDSIEAAYRTLLSLAAMLDDALKHPEIPALNSAVVKFTRQEIERGLNALQFVEDWNNG